MSYDGPFPQGVPNPFEPLIHNYPSRFHGAIYTRPMFSLPFRVHPNDFTVPEGTEGLGAVTEPRSEADCATVYPRPTQVVDAETFAAYAQHEACQEHVRQRKSGRRWLIGVAAAFAVGLMIGRRK